MRNLNQTVSCMMALLLWFSTSVASVAAETAQLATYRKNAEQPCFERSVFFGSRETRCFQVIGPALSYEGNQSWFRCLSAWGTSNRYFEHGL